MLRVMLAAATLASCATAHAALPAPLLSDGSDGVFRPTASLSLLPDSDGIFNFTDIEIPANVTVSFDASRYPTGIKFFATGNIIWRGTLDATGIDLTVTTPHEFLLDIGSSFLANQYNIVADKVTILGEFHPVAGGTVKLSTEPVTGSASFSGSGAIFYETALSVSLVEIQLLSTPFSLSPAVSSVPLPAPLSMLLPAVVAIFARRKQRDPAPGFSSPGA